VSVSGQFCPIARASEVFAERWTPLILREIMAGRHHFSEILKVFIELPRVCSDSACEACNEPA